MKLHQDNEEGPPCRHMETFLQKTADGSANFLERWYAQSHVKGCGRCHRFLDRLIDTVARLRTTKQDPPADVMERLKNGDWRK